MPSAAIEAGAVDAVLSLADLGAWVAAAAGGGAP
jgi:chemotaxis response regulator CheB